MFICEYCNKELKSKGGLTRHLKSCQSRISQEVSDIGDEILDEIDTNMKSRVEPAISKDKPITAEVCGVESDYYLGHPRRELKLRGLLSRTHDRVEREKICKIILVECK